jgi:hypothetical protein
MFMRAVVALLAIALASGCSQSAPAMDAAAEDASAPDAFVTDAYAEDAFAEDASETAACRDARLMAAAGLGSAALEFSAYAVPGFPSDPVATPVAWLDIACFDVRVEPHAAGESFEVLVFFGGGPTESFGARDRATGAALEVVTTDAGSGVQRARLLVPPTVTQILLDHHVLMTCFDGSHEPDGQSYPMSFDDLASTAALQIGECIECLGCPGPGRCASPETSIATAEGPRPIASLAAGDLVYSREGNAFVLVPLVRVSRTPVRNHRIVRVELDTGAVLEMSGPHPLGDGRRFADLRVGDRFDTARVVAVSVEPYGFDATYDILPASSTGTYIASGVTVGSTLAELVPGAQVDLASLRASLRHAD